MPKEISLHWTIQDVYTLLMREIDEDLLLENYPHLDEKYKEETPQKRNERYTRYAKEFEVFIDRYYTLMETLGRKVNDTYRTLRKQLERSATTKDEGTAEAMLDSMLRGQ
ncbi:TPA: hypothetical protein DCL30_05250 [Candidatus Peribacteria bacterium]|nr:MAG: hypothetical protein A3J91_05100 [Candidatus Peribacteria bacterium RIFOXYC2_FULL_58_10]OGJ84703.1 MAG: hypothetical protein A2529_00925 [Candidatus Peribacteria bacterium RIFOXYD2_FULL_58_15]HAI98903.1 hypothetical protein [Candidatus Peribacteria bacterium]HAS33700.1 hypothetical protein [Candidatus Peribacteria bacterium]